ncbi:MAG: hypothetical protein AAF572_20535 [Cyanobacteria bacterium P01_B01_bin.77]
MTYLQPSLLSRVAKSAVVIGTATLPAFQAHHGTIAMAMAASPLIPIRSLPND